MVHLRQTGLVHDSGRLSAQVERLQELTEPILRRPDWTFQWRLGATRTTAFVGRAEGRDVVVFVASEGKWAGKVLSAYEPSAERLAGWGIK